MTKSAKTRERRTLTTHDLERVFGVSAMTLYLWRQGIATRSKLRTAPKKGSRSVLYYEDDVRAWAAKHGVPIVVDPSRIKPHGSGSTKPTRARPVARRGDAASRRAGA